MCVCVCVCVYCVLLVEIKAGNIVILSFELEKAGTKTNYLC